MLAVLEICIFVDLYVTAAGILKLNHQLEAMAKIAAELHEISDKLGENIHEGMMDTMEATEERRKKLEAATAESRLPAYIINRQRHFLFFLLMQYWT